MQYYDLAYSFFSNPGVWLVIITTACFLALRYFGKFFRRLRKWRIGPVEIENETDIPLARVWRKIDNNSNECKKLNKAFDTIMPLLETQTQALEELRTGQLRLLFYAINAPIEERIYGGLRYIKKGKNGLMKKDVYDLCIDNIEKYKTIVLVHPELAIEDLNNVL